MALTVKRWVTQAYSDLAEGRPLEALAFARDLWWADHEAFRAEAIDLLARSYRALGREALAQIAEIHHAFRDLGWVVTMAGDSAACPFGPGEVPDTGDS